MKKLVFALTLLASAGFSQAALPPQYQNQMDLDVMVDFISQHPIVAARLVSINLKSYTIYFDDYCEAIFGRQPVDYPPKWLGPVGALEFQRATCPVD